VKGKWPVLSGSLVFLLCLMVSFPAKAQEERTGLWTAGAGLGLQGDTADGSAFAINLAGDYFLTHNFSVGPLPLAFLYPQPLPYKYVSHLSILPLYPQ